MDGVFYGISTMTESAYTFPLSYLSFVTEASLNLRDNIAILDRTTDNGRNYILTQYLLVSKFSKFPGELSMHKQCVSGSVGCIPTYEPENKAIPGANALRHCGTRLSVQQSNEVYEIHTTAV